MSSTIDSAQRNVALLVASCFFMENFDGTIVATASPRIARDLHVSSPTVGAVITAYLITLAVLIPLSGWMVARFGNRRIFFSAIVIFTLASLLCSTSSNISELVVFRVLQGCGGAMMVPVGRLAVLSRTAKPDLMRMMSYIVWPGLIAPVIAPLAGGVITTYASWRWLFLINIPLGLVALCVAIRIMPPSPSTSRARLDVVGVILTCSGLAALTYSAHILSEPGTSLIPVALAGGTAVALLVATVRHLLGSSDPLVDLRTLKIRSLRVSLSGSSLFWLVVGAVPFLLPLLFEDLFGWSPIRSGAVVLMVFVGNIGIKPATTYLINRFGFRANLVAATGGLAATMIAAGLFRATTPLGLIVVTMVVSGAARSLGLTAYNTLSFSDVPEAEMRHANTLAATSQQLFSGLGVAAATVALRAGGPIAGFLLPHADRGSAYGFAFVALACVALAATVGALRLTADAGNSIRSAARP